MLSPSFPAFCTRTMSLHEEEGAVGAPGGVRRGPRLSGLLTAPGTTPSNTTGNARPPQVSPSPTFSVDSSKRLFSPTAPNSNPPFTRDAPISAVEKDSKGFTTVAMPGKRLKAVAAPVPPQQLAAASGNDEDNDDEEDDDTEGAGYDTTATASILATADNPAASAQQQALPPRKDPNNVIILRGVAKTYLLGVEGVPALRGVSLTVRRGEVVVILGKSGSGKTTMLNVMATIDKPSRGDLFIGGMRVDQKTSDAALAEIRLKKVATIFQQFNLLPQLTLLENVELPMILAGAASRTARRRRAISLLKRVGLAERIHHLPAMCSGGEQQRATIARSLANNPSILLGDEATGNLDGNNSAIVMKTLLDLNAKHGLTIVLVTHDVSLKAYSHRTVHMLDGKISRIETTLPVLRQEALETLEQHPAVRAMEALRQQKMKQRRAERGLLSSSPSLFVAGSPGTSGLVAALGGSATVPGASPQAAMRGIRPGKHGSSNGSNNSSDNEDGGDGDDDSYLSSEDEEAPRAAAKRAAPRATASEGEAGRAAAAPAKSFLGWLKGLLPSSSATASSDSQVTAVPWSSGLSSAGMRGPGSRRASQGEVELSTSATRGRAVSPSANAKAGATIASLSRPDARKGETSADGTTSASSSSTDPRFAIDDDEDEEQDDAASPAARKGLNPAGADVDADAGLDEESHDNISPNPLGSGTTTNAVSFSGTLPSLVPPPPGLGGAGVGSFGAPPSALLSSPTVTVTGTGTGTGASNMTSTGLTGVAAISNQLFYQQMMGAGGNAVAATAGRFEPAGAAPANNAWGTVDALGRPGFGGGGQGGGPITIVRTPTSYATHTFEIKARRDEAQEAAIKKKALEEKERMLLQRAAAKSAAVAEAQRASRSHYYQQASQQPRAAVGADGTRSGPSGKASAAVTEAWV